MRIGIMGAPESGKSLLAENIAEELKPQSTFIVDNYIESAATDSNVLIFPLTPYIGNLLVAIKRFSLENKNKAEYDHLISVGTILETQLYEAIEGTDSSRFKPYEDEHRLRVESCLHILGCLYLDTFLYDVVFLNEYEGDSEDWKVFNEGLEKLITDYKQEFTILTGSSEDRTTQAIRVIEKAKKREASHANGRGTSGSRTQGTPDGNPPEPVSDMPQQTTDS